MGWQLRRIRRLRMALLLAMLALMFWSSSSEAGWLSFGYPAKHMDSIGLKNAEGTGAFNLMCQPGDNMVIAQVISNSRATKTVVSLIIDGKTVGKKATTLTPDGSPPWLNFLLSDAEATRWLEAIASATSDIEISATNVGSAHFPVDGAKNAASTAMDYCKLK